MLCSFALTSTLTSNRKRISTALMSLKGSVPNTTDRSQMESTMTADCNVPVSNNQVLKGPRKAEVVRPEHKTSNPIKVSAAEWKVRCELAATYRSLFQFGLGGDMAAQCVMSRVTDEGSGDHFVSHAWGDFFEEVTASSLLKFDFEGNRITDLKSGAKSTALPDVSNMGCLPVATAIFKARPDVNCVIHIHPLAVMAVAGLEEGLLPCSQAAFFLHGQVSREEYDFSYEDSFEDGLANGFRNGKRAMLLNHHGMYAVGRNAAEALFVAIHLNQACEVQVRTMAMADYGGCTPIFPDGALLTEQYKDMMASPDYSYDGSREWPGVVRKVIREHPDFNT